MTQLNDLPLEISYIIFDHLTPEDIANLLKSKIQAIIKSVNFYIEDNKLERIVNWAKEIPSGSKFKINCGSTNAYYTIQWTTYHRSISDCGLMLSKEPMNYLNIKCGSRKIVPRSGVTFFKHKDGKWYIKINDSHNFYGLNGSRISITTGVMVTN